MKRWTIPELLALFIASYLGTLLIRFLFGLF
jgi:hypothetical protein